MTNKCSVCGEDMPEGEEMFKYHGYSGECPKPPLFARNTEYDHLDRPLPVPPREDIEALKKNSDRYLWLLTHLRVDRMNPGDWACCLVLGEIPFRSQATEPEKLLDELLARFPLEGK